jgi:hypothetical protein
MAWKGGSEVMGGAPPIGAGMKFGGYLLLEMTTLRLVKCSVSLAIADTISWVTGNQPPP